MMLRVVFFILCVFSAGVCGAGTILIEANGSGDFVTIQAGIDAAAPGDVVVLGDGVYTGEGNRDIDFAGKAMTVRSANGPEHCIIDCEGSESESHRGFNFHSGEDKSSVLEGITVTNGVELHGGGINCESGPLIRNCRLIGNRACGVHHEGEGGDSMRTTGDPEVVDCVFVDSSTDVHANLFCPMGSPVFERCRFEGSGLLIGSNEYGGQWKGTIRYCVFDIRPEPGFYRMAVETYVGAHQHSGELIVENSLFFCTSGIYLSHQALAPGVTGVIRNNVIVSSQAGEGFGVLYRMHKSTPLITGNIITGFKEGIYFTYDSSYDERIAQIRYNNLWDNTFNTWIDAYRSEFELVGLGGNISADPVFIDRGVRDFRLVGGSPCIDGGDPEFVAGEGETDFAGKERVVDGDFDGAAVVDMGAFEYDPSGEFCAVGWFGEFGRIDSRTGEGQLIRTDMPPRLQALAWSRDGVLYAGREDDLFVLDPQTGETEHVLSFRCDIRGMAFGRSGELYVTSEHSTAHRFRTIDVETGEVHEKGELWGDGLKAQGLAFSPDGVLYAIHPHRVEPYSYDLFTVDLDDAEMHVVGSYPAVTAGVSQSITFTQDGRLWAIGANVFAQLDPADGSIIGTPIQLEGEYRGLASLWVAPNEAPVADAGDDVEAYAGIDGAAEVVLDGSGSYDGDGDELDFRWLLDGEEIGSGVRPSVELGVGEYSIELIVSDGWDESSDEVVVTVVGAVETSVRVLPRVINVTSRGRGVAAIMDLPEGIVAADIAGDYGVVFEPGGLEARYWRVVGNEGKWRLYALFERDEVVDALGGEGSVEVNVACRLLSGRYLFGSDKVKVIGNARKRVQRGTGARSGRVGGSVRRR